MKLLGSFVQDEAGSSAVEFGMTVSVFILFVFAVIEAGLLFWSQIGLQHGAEMAARCATINSTTCANASAITTYASQQAYGLTFPSNTFVYASAACGNQVTASYSFQFPSFMGIAPLSLTAASCYPS